LLNVLSVSGKPKILGNNLGAGGGASASGVGDTTEDGGDGGDGGDDGGDDVDDGGDDVDDGGDDVDDGGDDVDDGVAAFLIGPSEVDGDGTGDDTSFPSELMLIS
jgi:hypothetical protein